MRELEQAIVSREACGQWSDAAREALDVLDSAAIADETDLDRLEDALGHALWLGRALQATYGIGSQWGEPLPAPPSLENLQAIQDLFQVVLRAMPILMEREAAAQVQVSRKPEPEGQGIDRVTRLGHLSRRSLIAATALKVGLARAHEHLAISPDKPRPT